MDKLRYEYLLPIGSIIKVNGIKQRVMVTGVLQTTASYPDHTFDYVAVPYPLGAYDSRMSICVNHADIEEVIFRGYEDKERHAFLLLLEAAYRRHIAQHQNPEEQRE